MRCNFDNLIAELSGRNLSPDIIILSEVWINANEISYYNIPDYKSYIKSNDDHRAGGVVMYIKSNIEIIFRNLVNFQSAYVLNINVKINLTEFCIFAVYRLHNIMAKTFS